MPQFASLYRHPRAQAPAGGAAPERLVDDAGAHRGAAAPFARPHQRDGVALVGDRAVGGEQPLGVRQVRGVPATSCAATARSTSPIRAAPGFQHGGEETAAGEHPLFRERA